VTKLFFCVTNFVTALKTVTKRQKAFFKIPWQSVTKRGNTFFSVFNRFSAFSTVSQRFQPFLSVLKGLQALKRFKNFKNGEKRFKTVENAEKRFVTLCHGFLNTFWRSVTKRF
jgi:hypothetical protein